MLCISGQNCSITSPTIERKGYAIIGWNTNKNATKSTWNANTSKNISSSATYYPITKAYIVTIKFSTNNGSLTSPTVTSTGNTYKWRENNGIIERTNANGSTYSDSFFKIKYNGSTASDGLPNYNYSKYLKITKTGYSVVSKEEWKCKSGCTTSGKTYDQSVVYKASDFCDATNKDCTVVLGVNWKVNTYTITYNANGGAGSWEIRLLIMELIQQFVVIHLLKQVIHLLDGQQEQMAWMMVITGQDGVVLGNM